MLVNRAMSKLVLLGVLLPLSLQAAEPLALASTSADAPRFFPLDAAARAGSKRSAALPVVAAKRFYPLRSDAEQLKRGAMRIDRSQAAPVAAQHALALKPAAPDKGAGAAAQMPGAETLEPESEEIAGNTETINPVLALFGNEATPSSFREALSGKVATSIAGLARHAGWPLPLSAKQYVSSTYGMRDDPFHHRPAFHGGIDIAADVGTPVLATADGTVTQRREDGNYGKYITLQHADGTLSRYGHLSAQTVSEGQVVRAGQLIGAVGATGRATGAHLDYRVSKNGTRFDPLAVLTIPASVALDTGAVKKPALAAVPVRGATVAQNALPRRPMVIQVR